MVLILWDFSESRILRSPDGGWWWALSNVWNTTSELVKQALEWIKTSPKSFKLWKADWWFFDIKFDSNTMLQNAEGLSFSDITKILYFCHINNKKISEALEFLKKLSDDNWVKKFLSSLPEETILSEVIRFYF